MTEEVPSLNKLAYGGDDVTIMSADGMSQMMIAPELILANEIEIATAKPGELAPEQQVTAFLLTFKGVDAKTKAPRAVTLVFEPSLADVLFRATRKKFVEIPIEHR